MLPEHAAEVGGVDETPARGQHRHATVAQRRVFQVAADRLEAFVPDQAADRPRLVREQPVEGNGSRFGSQSSWDEFTQWQWVTARPQAHGFPF